ncbi:hypothetical protein AB0F72_41850 [Actinoplanes sp. NPDC023936]|uniref:hypothetical protein n=1 Tax=Actinoplanes sp. NPDC023936 TaxID=3154910 RepID=UPI0033DAB322
MWVEHSPQLDPGAQGTVRLAPLAPFGWRSLQPGQSITIHEGTPVVGTGTIVEVVAPV